MDFYKEYEAILKLDNLKQTVLKSLTQFTHPKSLRYFQKAFARWIFQLISQKQFKDFYPSLWTLEMLIQHELEMYAKQFNFKKNLSYKMPRKFPPVGKSDTLPPKPTLEVQDKSIFYPDGKPGVNKIVLPVKYNLKGSIPQLFIYGLRYSVIGSQNQHLSVPPNIIKKYGDVELFGSMFNTQISYCSPFSDEPGSLGPFEDLKLHPNKTYIFNCPFDEDIIAKNFKKVLAELDTTQNITVIAALPAWDSETQTMLNRRVYNMHFEALEIAKKSKHLKDWEIAEKEKYPYYNYYNDTYASTVDSHILILSNKKDLNISGKDILELWGKNKP